MKFSLTLVLQFLYMLPLLVNLGPVKIYSYGVFLAIGLFFALYWWWKMGRDEHFEEISLFDSFFLSLFIFLIAGRIGYVFLHFADLGTIYRTLALFAFPGIHVPAGVLGSVFFLVLYGRAHDWDTWKLMDAYVVSLALIFVIGGIGGLLNGSNPGLPVSWGLMYPGETVRRIPIDIWIIIWAFLTFGIVSSVRKNFRFYAWYKAEASVVREGLATLVFGIAVSVYYLVASWLVASPLKIGFVPISFVLALLFLCTNLVLIYRRVGRKNSPITEGLRSSYMGLLQWVRRVR